DRLTAAYQQLAVMGIGRNPAARVAYQQHIAVAAQLVAGISNDPVFSRTHDLARLGCDVDAVVIKSSALGAEARDDLAAHWPQELGARARRRVGIGIAQGLVAARRQAQH